MQNDRDRLVELLDDCRYMEGYGMDLVEKQADHLIANGVIVPPCKVGETLYLIQVDYEGTYGLSECLVSSKITMLSILRAREEQTITYMSTNKSEAEEKLKELEGSKR